MSKGKMDEQVFDVKRIASLIELMKEHDLSEIDLRQDARRIRLRRGPTGVPVVTTAPVFSSPSGPVVMDAPSSVEKEDDSNCVYIVSPTVGTFYSKKSPEAKPFVQVGDIVSPDTVVCLVEAMKMFNEIPAGVSGKIVACLVKNEEPVDVNRQLFKVLPT
jgi:acetyl-CoA carboxylase biotin carboxyl carrier protein